MPFPDIRFQNQRSNNLTVPLPAHLREGRPSALTLTQDRSPFQKEGSSATSSAGPRTATCDTTELPDREAASKTPDRFWFRCYAAFFALFTAGWADGCEFLRCVTQNFRTRSSVCKSSDRDDSPSYVELWQHDSSYTTKIAFQTSRKIST